MGGDFTQKSILREDERADDLQYKGLRLIQSPASFCFGTDSVLLTHFALETLCRAKKGSRAIDLGCGSGVISLLLNAKTGVEFTAVDRDAEQCERFARTLALNALDNGRIRIINADYLDRSAEMGRKYDYAVCNPPYFRINAGKLSLNGEATHEMTADIAGIAEAAAGLLKFGGKLFLCYPTERLSEAFCALTSAGIEPKLLRLVQTKAEARPYLALIRANRGAKSGMITERNLILYGEDGKYTEEVEKIYNGE